MTETPSSYIRLLFTIHLYFVTAVLGTHPSRPIYGVKLENPASDFHILPEVLVLANEKPQASQSPQKFQLSLLSHQVV